MPAKKAWRPFKEAREFARSLNLRNIKEWYQYSKSGKDGMPRPNDIPSAPDGTYKNDGWIDWVDWLGNEDRVMTEESRRKISEANKGRKHTEETKRKLSEAWNNRKLSEEQIKRSEMHNARRNQESNNTLYEICVYEGIKYEPEKKIDLIHFHWHKYRFIKVDVFIEPNICLFADNDLYHANPKPYRTTRDRWYDGHKPNDPWIKAPNSGILAKDIWWEDDGITRDLESQGYKVLRFWGSDLLYYTARCRQEVIGAVRKSKEYP